MSDDQHGEAEGLELPMTGEELKKLFAEWEADYAARREENRREREGWPRETA